MRASRLLRMLLILQNRGKTTSAVLADELEVSQRTILRDIDALTEAGLPVIVHRGQSGGIELGFDYRTRLTGLDRDEAEAMAVLMSVVPPEVSDLGLGPAAKRAQAKIREAFPDRTRMQMSAAIARFRPASDALAQPDRRRAALAEAVRDKRIVRLQSRSPQPIVVHPAALVMTPLNWVLLDDRSAQRWHENDWGDVNISAKRYA